MARNLVICLDGTSGSVRGSGDSNPVRVYELLDHGDPEQQFAYYDAGVGTFASQAAWTPLARAFSRLGGVIWGGGLRQNLGEVYSWLMREWQPGDRIFVFGFSRGAFTARALVGMLRTIGLMRAGSENQLPYAVASYARRGGEGRLPWDEIHRFAGLFARPVDRAGHTTVPVHYLGIWDSVKAMGIARLAPVWPYTRALPNAARIRHAVSIDEWRRPFAEYLVESPTPERLEEVWFPGNHCDVGGTYPKDPRLSTLSLVWAVEGAIAEGLRVDEKRWRKLLDSITPDYPLGEKHGNFWLWGALIPRRRRIPEGAVLHAGIRARIAAGDYRPRLPRRFRWSDEDPDPGPAQDASPESPGAPEGAAAPPEPAESEAAEADAPADMAEPEADAPVDTAEPEEDALPVEAAVGAEPETGATGDVAPPVVGAEPEGAAENGAPAEHEDSGAGEEPAASPAPPPEPEESAAAGPAPADRSEIDRLLAEIDRIELPATAVPAPDFPLPDFAQTGRGTIARDWQAAHDPAPPPPAEGPDRLLQARLRGADTIVNDNVLRAGTNIVSVFLGAQEQGTLIGSPVPQSLLGFDDPDQQQTVVTVVLAPLEPIGEAVQRELRVPRLGRTDDVALRWDLSSLAEGTTVRARILLVHRNRVLQTALLGGQIGSAAEFTDRMVLRRDTGDLAARGSFDRAIVLNHTPEGEARLVSHADGDTVIRSMDEIAAIAARIHAQLAKATQLTSKGKTAQEAARRILVELALHGHDLHDTLATALVRFADAERVQIVSARSAQLLPLELAYPRPAPDAAAALCAHWLAGEECGPGCFRDDDDTSIVCPAVFWGLSRVIERFDASLGDPDGDAFVVSASPSGKSAPLAAQRVVLAASSRVRAADVARTAGELAGSVVAASWDEWKAALAETPSEVLLLMPHTDQAAGTMEISGAPLDRGRIERPYVTGGLPVTPVVVLFGCDTAGSAEDPAGFSARFLMKGARVVFSTTTLLLGRHAAELSARLVRELRAPGEAPRTVGEITRSFRRDAVRAGLLSALAVASYGDADWGL